MDVFDHIKDLLNGGTGSGEDIKNMLVVHSACFSMARFGAVNIPPNTAKSS